MSDLTETCDRWALRCTTRRCRPCCGSESAPGSSTKRRCGDCRGSWRESLLFHLLSDQCSGQGASRSTPSPTSCTMRLLLAVNMVYALDRCGTSCAWPPKLKDSHCAPTTKVPLFLRKIWRDIREYCCKAQKSHKTRGEECLKPTQQKPKGSP